MSFCQHRLVLLSFGSVVTGSVSTLALKAVYETRIHGEAFAKPFFMELLVGAAMTTSLAMVPCERGVGVMPARTRSRARHYAPLVPLAASDLLVGLGDMAAVLLAPASIVSLVGARPPCSAPPRRTGPRRGTRVRRRHHRRRRRAGRRRCVFLARRR